MSYNPSRLGLIGINRVSPFTANEVGDLTAGGSSNVQQYMDARRKYRGNVADTAARDGLANVTAGDWVLIEGLTRIDMYDGAAWVPVSGGGGGGGPVNDVTRVTTGFPYLVDPDQLILISNSTLTGPVEFVLPAAPSVGQEHRIKDGKGDAYANHVTISTAGSELIDGTASVAIQADFGSVTVVWNGLQWSIM